MVDSVKKIIIILLNIYLKKNFYERSLIFSVSLRYMYMSNVILNCQVLKLIIEQNYSSTLSFWSNELLDKTFELSLQPIKVSSEK